MKLHTNKQDFTELIQLTATHFAILPEFIEKDYWITLILNNLSQSSHANSVVFKGGTSLTGYSGDSDPHSGDSDPLLILIDLKELFN